MELNNERKLNGKEFMRLDDRRSRVLRLDVTGSKESVAENLRQFAMSLAMLQSERNSLAKSYVLPFVSLAADTVHVMKKNDLLKRKSDFEVAHIAKGHMGTDSALFAAALAQRMNPLEVNVSVDKKHTAIDILPLNELLVFNSIGSIKYSRDKDLRGRDALQVITSYMHQDVGILKVENQKLIYTFDSSVYEKTPKNPLTGRNNFVGRDALSFHGKAKNFGQILPDLFRGIEKNFAEDKLDGLIIDLKGANLYSNGAGIPLRRFERDYAVPVIKNGNMRGIIVYADVFFQLETVNPMNSPFEGGSFLNIKDPALFHKEFKVMSNDEVNRYKTRRDRL